MKGNQRQKPYGTVVLSVIMLGWAIYIIVTWPVREESSSAGNAYGWKVQDDWQRLKQALRLTEDVRLEDFRLEWDADGTIRELRFQLFPEPDDDGILMHKVVFDPEQNRYKVRTNRFDKWAQYDRLVSAERFFAALDQLDLRRVTLNNQASYVLESEGWEENYAIRDRTKYMLQKGELVPIADSQLPVKGVWLSLREMPSVQKDADGRETSAPSANRQVWDILFDPTKEETGSQNGVTMLAASG